MSGNAKRTCALIDAGLLAINAVTVRHPVEAFARKRPRMSTLRKSEKRIGCLAALLLLIIVPVGAFMYARHENTMNLAPADLEVTGIVYDKQENWGSPLLPLPGDNETGLIVYGLTDSVANKITAEGINFFNREKNRERRKGRQRSHSEWRETPVVTDNRWVFKGGPPAKIAAYLGKYGFGIVIDKFVEDMIDQAIQQSGSYYSHGRTGIVIDYSRRQARSFCLRGIVASSCSGYWSHAGLFIARREANVCFWQILLQKIMRVGASNIDSRSSANAQR